MHPTLFHVPTPFGALAVQSFGLCLGLSLLLGWYLLRRDPAYHDERAGRLYLLMVMAALAGARLVYLLATPEAYRSPFDLVAMGDGGLSAFGAILGVLALYPYLRRLERDGALPGSALGYLDTLALPMLLSASLVALGNYLAGACFGRPLSSSAPGFIEALGTFPEASAREGALGRFTSGPPVLRHQRAHLDALAADASASLPVHPVQLYEALLFTLSALGLWAFARRAPREGLAAASALAAFALVRLATEPFRGDPERVLLTPSFSLPTLFSILLLLCVISALITERALDARRLG